MNTMFDDRSIRNVEDLLPFVSSCESFDLQASCSIAERAEWIRERLIRFRYRKMLRSHKAVLRSYLCRVTGLSSRAMKYHITAYTLGKPAPGGRYRRHRFQSRFTSADQTLLAQTDILHERLNGAATLAIMNEEFARGSAAYERLAGISVSHLYNLRSGHAYKQTAMICSKTKSVQVSIGERRRPDPQGKPGFLRVDTVHQGDRDGIKGVYHINLVDEVTQWQVVLAAPQISEAFLWPLLEEALILFPFTILGFHSDNGSEFINKTVATLLEKLLIEQTKSRARRSTDNGLVESKNGSTIRKHMGHWHIPGDHASRINLFYREHFIPYLNFHRPCGFPYVTVNAKGKREITYPKSGYATPYKKLLSLPDWEKYLITSVTASGLEKQAMEKTPNHAAGEMQSAKKILLGIVIPPYGL